MILVDVNILIYATDRRSPQHAVARDWLDSQLTDSVALGNALAQPAGVVMGHRVPYGC